MSRDRHEGDHVSITETDAPTDHAKLRAWVDEVAAGACANAAVEHMRAIAHSTAVFMAVSSTAKAARRPPPMMRLAAHGGATRS